MSLTTLIKSSLVATAAVIALTGAVSVSAAQVDYTNPNNQQVKTPVFNMYTNTPAGIGNEADFVKLRKSTGDPTVTAVQASFSDPLNDACNVGDKFDVRTYVHNGANDEYNDNGAGSAVAKNVRVAMQAPLGTKGKKFTFTSTVNSSNATSVTDTGVLNCNNEVRLKLVAQTVKVYSRPTGWNNAADSAVNGSLTIGSRAAGSGNVWGCWEDRVTVVYTVEVEKIPEIPKETPKTPEKPVVTPVITTLPSTGIGGIVTGLLGSSVTTYGAYSLYQKRRALKK